MFEQGEAVEYDVMERRDVGVGDVWPVEGLLPQMRRLSAAVARGTRWAGRPLDVFGVTTPAETPMQLGAVPSLQDLSIWLYEWESRGFPGLVLVADHEDIRLSFLWFDGDNVFGDADWGET